MLYSCLDIPEDIIPIVIGVEGHNFAEALRLFIYTEFYAGIVVYKFEGFKGSTFTHKPLI